MYGARLDRRIANLQREAASTKIERRIALLNIILQGVGCSPVVMVGSFDPTSCRPVVVAVGKDGRMAEVGDLWIF